MSEAPLPKVDGFLLVIGRDGRVKVDDWNGLTADQQRQVAEYVVATYPRGQRNGSDA
jgi:hypothetical protein